LQDENAVKISTEKSPIPNIKILTCRVNRIKYNDREKMDTKHKIIIGDAR